MSANWYAATPTTTGSAPLVAAYVKADVAAARRAGADIGIGNLPHWVQAMEVCKGKPIWYALGDFTFDQSWSEPTLERITLELTFRGGMLAQARINLHVLVLAVQPDLLGPAGDGQRVLGPMFKASASMLPW